MKYPPVAGLRASFTTSDELISRLELGAEPRVSLRIATQVPRRCQGCGLMSGMCGPTQVLLADVELPSVTGGAEEHGFELTADLHLARSPALPEGNELTYVELIDAHEPQKLTFEVMEHPVPTEVCLDLTVRDLSKQSVSIAPLCMHAQEVAAAIRGDQTSCAVATPGAVADVHAAWWASMLGLLLAFRRRVRLTLAMLVAFAWSVAGCASEHSEGQHDGKNLIDSGIVEVEIYPHKLYSAYIEGSDQVFQVPAVVGGVRADSWKCSDPAAVDLEMDALPNGVMITTRKPGKFKIRATSGRNMNQVELEVSAATEEQLEQGLFLYNEPVDHSFEGHDTAGWMTNASCKDCHASGDKGLAIEYTPQQIGGYSDDELKAIFSMGAKLPGRTYGSLQGIEKFFPLFHKWTGSDAEYQALVVYLRSFKPVSQGGLDFD